MRKKMPSINHNFIRIFVFGFSSFLCSYTGFAHADSIDVVRIAYLPNITHAQALVGLSNGSFKKTLGDKIRIEPTLFNAGPSIVEALFGNSIDLAYIGPNPALNAFVKSKGTGVRIIAGACSGGAKLIVREGASITKTSDFHGKSIATPQFGNTQDIAARDWLVANGLNSLEKGGDVRILPLKNADQLPLFLQKQIDASWAPEPWASKLVHEAKGKVFLDEKFLWKGGQFSTTVLIVRPQFMKAHPELVRAWIKAHVEVTEWIRRNPSEAKTLINAQLEKLTGKGLSNLVLNDSFSSIEITANPLEASFELVANAAFKQGFLGATKPDLSGIFDLHALHEFMK